MRLRCDDCGHEEISYNSCRNRHIAPSARHAARWLDARTGRSAAGRVLPRRPPEPISAIAYTNKAAIYRLLFDVAAETLTTIAADPKHLGAQIGANAGVAYLSALTHHPHVHGIVPGGGLPGRRALDACRRGFSCRCGCFPPVPAALYRRTGEISSHRATQFFGEHAGPTEATVPSVAELRSCEWVVAPSVRLPVPGGVGLPPALYPSGRDLEPATGGDGRNGRDLPLEGLPSQGTNSPQDDDACAGEFMRRSLHVLPSGFHRIRHYGLLANAGRRANRPRWRFADVPPPELVSDETASHVRMQMPWRRHAFLKSSCAASQPAPP